MQVTMPLMFWTESPTPLVPCFEHGHAVINHSCCWKHAAASKHHVLVCFKHGQVPLLLSEVL